MRFHPGRALVIVALICAILAALAGARAPGGDAAAKLGVKMVEEISPWGSDTLNSTIFNGNLYFAAADGVHGYELWKSDGTSAAILKDIDPSGDGYPIGYDPYPILLKGSLYFAASDGVNGYELWKSDGTDGGTVMFKDINSGGSSYPYDLIVVNDTLFFVADDGIHGAELWKSDGTSDGTVMVKDITAGSGASYLQCLTPLGDSLYFSNVISLWKSDGTEAGTVPVTDITHVLFVSELTVFNGALYFGGYDEAHNTELWKSDGIPETLGGTTSMVKDINPNPSAGSRPWFPIVFNGDLYFTADDGTHGRELWKSDGTAAGTTMVADINPSGDGGPEHLSALGGNLYFGANDGVHGDELWKSDGTETGTVMVKDINPVGNGYGYPVGFDMHPVFFDGKLYFAASDGMTAPIKLGHGIELWQSDGTTAGTVMVEDINPSGDSVPKNFIVFKGSVYFAATDGTHGAGLWKTGDFSPPETWISSGPSGRTTVTNPSFTFSADEPASFECALDGGGYSSCTSPKAVGPLSLGAHTFRVRATDTSGNVEPSPAERSFTLVVSTTSATAPQTKIVKHPKKVVSTSATKASAVFKFTSSKKGSHFSCKLDKGKWKSCRSPKSYKVKPGKHTFRVRATYAGHTDRTPAIWVWRVKR